jgi:hypothetical protein
MRELMEHQLLNFEVANFIETNENEIEFYVNLRKVDIKKISLNKQLSTLPVTTPERDAIGELEEQVMVLQQELEALKSSVSWRSTKVLRTVRGVQKKLKP